LQHNPGKTRQKTVGQSRSSILLVNHERAAGQPGGNAARPANEAAHAEYRGRAASDDDGEGLNEGPGKLDGRNDQRKQTLAAQAAYADPLHADAGGRYDA
jgi:hypothetical protein